MLRILVCQMTKDGLIARLLKEYATERIRSSLKLHLRPNTHKCSLFHDDVENFLYIDFFVVILLKLKFNFMGTCR